MVVSISPDDELPFPADFLARLREIIPPQYLAQCLASFGSRSWLSFRVNTLKVTPQELEQELHALGIPFRHVAWLREAYLVGSEKREVLVNSAAFLTGRLYIQDLSSMLAVHLLDPQEGDEILDLAAAPGGKTSHMAARMNNRGRIAAVEVIPQRLYKLVANLKRLGVTIVQTYLTDGRNVGRKTPNRFDRVLLDAPCSSEARFDPHDPASWSHWSLRKIAECARKQKGLLFSALEAVRPGGVVLYCTCSFAPEENEGVIDHVLQQWGDSVSVEPTEIALPNVVPGLTVWQGREFDSSLRFARRILPTDEMQGFFLCRLRKNDESPRSYPSGKSRVGKSRKRRPQRLDPRDCPKVSEGHVYRARLEGHACRARRMAMDCQTYFADPTSGSLRKAKSEGHACHAR
jgi:NOL1/NOP2/sun family putative RNA methylase